MRTNSSRGSGRSNNGGQALFGSTGWLFADLMLALAMAFLVANTVGLPTLPKPKPTVRPTPTPTPTPTATPTPTPALDLRPVHVVLQVDWAGLLSNSPTARAAVRSQIRHVAALDGRHAGLVLAFGGDNDNNTTRALAVASKVDSVLAGLGSSGYVFQSTVYRSFIGLADPPGVVEVDIYVFKRQPGQA